MTLEGGGRERWQLREGVGVRCSIKQRSARWSVVISHHFHYLRAFIVSQVFGLGPRVPPTPEYQAAYQLQQASKQQMTVGSTSPTVNNSQHNNTTQYMMAQHISLIATHRRPTSCKKNSFNQIRFGGKSNISEEETEYI